LETFQVAEGQEFNFFAAKIPQWKGWLASLVIDAEGNAVGTDGTSKTVGNDTDLQLLLSLRAKADVIVTTGKTARAENYKASRFAPIAFITRHPESLATLPAIANPGAFENVYLTSSTGDSSIFERFDRELSERGFESVLFEGGKSSLAELLASTLPARLVLSIANVPKGFQLSPQGLLSKTLPMIGELKLEGQFRTANNIVLLWYKP
jgi:riboflavin biosynthesis pyrimidine reductase